MKDDLISRQAAIDEITIRAERCAERLSTDNPFFEGLIIARNIIERLTPVQAIPSVQPELIPESSAWYRIGETLVDESKGHITAEQAVNKIRDCLWRMEKPEWKKDEWIPISKETNPAKSGWYLVTVHENATFDNERFTAMAEFNATDGVWYDIDEPTDMYLRWMPLPEPYKGE